MGRRRGALACALASCLLAAALAPGLAPAADDELVGFLVKEGCAALDKGKTDDAIAKFRKATNEDRDAPQAWAWLGQALEKKGDKPAAIDAYRGIGPAVAARRRAGGMTPDVQDAVKRAVARLEALAPGEVELRRVQEGYLADLLALARATLEKDPATAKRALAVALGIAPDDAAVRELAEKLGVQARVPAAAAAPRPDGGKPEAGIAHWDDWIARKAIESSHATYDASTLQYEVRDEGEIAWAEPQSETGDRFVLDMEMRVLDRTAVTSHAGWAFFEKGDRFVAAFLKQDEVVLFQTVGDEKKDLGRADVAEAKDKSAWRRLTVSIVDKRHVTVAVDGKTLITHDLPEAFDGEGRTGIWTQRAKVEYRRLRVGTP